MTAITVGVLALQGAFSEHIQHLESASKQFTRHFRFLEVRTPTQLAECDALIIPGGESTTMSLVAARCGMLEPLREYVKVLRKPVWGTCAGLILLAEAATRTKKGGQELIGGLDVRVNRNHFGRQVESFEADLDLGFLYGDGDQPRPFHTVFIRAPVVEKVLPRQTGIQTEEAEKPDIVVAPSRKAREDAPKDALEGEVEILARLPRKAHTLPRVGQAEHTVEEVGEDGDIVAVRQGNVFGTSFHPELTGDDRIHAWWLKQVAQSIESGKQELVRR